MKVSWALFGPALRKLSNSFWLYRLFTNLINMIFFLNRSHLWPPRFLSSSIYSSTRRWSLHRRLHYTRLPDSTISILHSSNCRPPTRDWTTLGFLICPGKSPSHQVERRTAGHYAVDLHFAQVRYHHHTEPDIKLWNENKVGLLGSGAHIPSDGFGIDDLGTCTMQPHRLPVGQKHRRRLVCGS